MRPPTLLLESSGLRAQLDYAHSQRNTPGAGQEALDKSDGESLETSVSVADVDRLAGRAPPRPRWSGVYTSAPKP